MSDSCPGKVCLHVPSLISHSCEKVKWSFNAVSLWSEASNTLADASQAPETNVRISGDNESDITSPVWPVNDVHC